MNLLKDILQHEVFPALGCTEPMAVAIVYQLRGPQVEPMTLAVNSLVSDLGGMLCDGAKEGYALKVVSSTDAAIRAAYMAVNDHGITAAEGYVGATDEETISNLSRIGLVGMAQVDPTMLGIMRRKSARARPQTPTGPSKDP